MKNNHEYSDVALITVDCWRSDATNEMLDTSEVLSRPNWTEETTTTHAAATAWSFPSILAGQYFPNVLEFKNKDKNPTSSWELTVAEEVETLPEIMSTNGYSTAAFVADNPNVQMWEPYFDKWQNKSQTGLSSLLPHKMETIGNLFLQRKRVPARELTAEALSWMESTQSPKFLWIHYMEPHSPYYAGLSRAVSNGLFKTYRTAYNHLMNSHEMVNSPNYERFLSQLERMYWMTVRELDESIAKMLQYLEDTARVMLTGDHGEEFSDDWFGHSRPYDDTIRVPFITNIPGSYQDLNRQVEIPYNILKDVEIDPPSSWKHTVEYSKNRSFVIHPSVYNYERLFVGCRTPEYYYLQLRDPSNGTIETEQLFSNTSLSAKRVDISDSEPEICNELRTATADFLNEFNIDITRYTTVSKGTEDVPSNNITESVDSRLRELGYK